MENTNEIPLNLVSFEELGMHAIKNKNNEEIDLNNYLFFKSLDSKYLFLVHNNLYELCDKAKRNDIFYINSTILDLELNPFNTENHFEIERIFCINKNKNFLLSINQKIIETNILYIKGKFEIKDLLIQKDQKDFFLISLDKENYILIDSEKLKLEAYYEINLEGVFTKLYIDQNNLLKTNFNIIEYNDEKQKKRSPKITNRIDFEEINKNIGGNWKENFKNTSIYLLDRKITFSENKVIKNERTFLKRIFRR
jgi:hypothetical protein